MIFILENRTTVWNEIVNSDAAIKTYLILEINKLLKNPDLTEWVDCHVERNSPPATNEIIQEMRKLTS